MELFYPVDLAMGELNPRLPISEIQELNSQMAANLFESGDESEHWLDYEPGFEMIRIIDESEFLQEI